MDYAKLHIKHRRLCEGLVSESVGYGFNYSVPIGRCGICDTHVPLVLVDGSPATHPTIGMYAIEPHPRYPTVMEVLQEEEKAHLRFVAELDELVNPYAVVNQNVPVGPLLTLIDRERITTR